MNRGFKEGFEKTSAGIEESVWDRYKTITGQPLFTDHERDKIRKGRPGFFHPLKRKVYDDELHHVVVKRWHAGTFNADAKAKNRLDLRAKVHPNTNLEKTVLGIRESY